MNIRLNLLILFLLSPSACTQASRGLSVQSNSVQSNYGSEVPRSQIPNSQISKERQIIIYVNGGQRISVPTNQTEVGILWSAPNNLVQHANYSKLLKSNYLPNSFLGEISELEALLASHYLEQLLNKNNATTRRVAKRAESYLPYIIEEIEKRGLPIELAALPMIESAYIPNAVSHAGAAGLWQIMPLTGKDLGLEVSNQSDERFHFEKSTQAALNHLEMLYASFNDWPLAISAYNCGEGRLRRALKISETNNLVDLLNYCKTMPPRKSPLSAETQRYVPQFIAASISLKSIGVLPNTGTRIVQDNQAITASETRTTGNTRPQGDTQGVSKASATSETPKNNTRTTGNVTTTNKKIRKSTTPTEVKTSIAQKTNVTRVNDAQTADKTRANGSQKASATRVNKTTTGATTKRTNAMRTNENINTATPKQKPLQLQGDYNIPSTNTQPQIRKMVKQNK